MASVVEICNLALAYLGDDATIASIDPPEGSAQAEHCQRFYEIARNSLLEMQDWNFATRRISGALLTYEFEQWEYAYQYPSDAQRIIAVLDPNATSDYAVPNNKYQDPDFNNNFYAFRDTAQQFAIESQTDGTRIILTNQEDALIRYQALVTDPTKFSANFTEALAWSLASKLAGPLLKGKEGRQAALNAMQMMNSFLSKAQDLDSSQRQINPEYSPSMIAAR